MNQLTTIRSRWFHYMMDALFAALATVWMYAPFNKSVVLPVLAIMIFGGVLLEFILPKINITLGKIIWILPFLWGLGWLMGLEWFLIIAVGLVTVLRFTQHFLDSDLGQEVLVFLFSIIGLIAFFILYRLNDDLFIALLITLIQLILLLLVRVNRALRTIETNSTIQRYVTYTFVGFLALTGVVAALFSYIKQGFMAVISFFVSALAIVFYYPVNAFFSWLESHMDGDNGLQSQEKDDASDQNEEFMNQEYTGSEFIDWFNTVLLIAAIFIAIWVIIKLYQKHLKMKGQVTIASGVDSHILGYDEPKHLFRTRRRARENRIRKRLYQLERKMAKYENGRFGYESVHEWLDRIDPPDDLYDQITEIYQQVRYGEQDVTNEQTTEYETAIQNMISFAKERYRTKMKKKKKKKN